MENKHGYELLLVAESKRDGITKHCNTVLEQKYINPDDHLFYALYAFTEEAVWHVDTDYEKYTEALRDLKYRGIKFDDKVLEAYRMKNNPNHVVVTISDVHTANYKTPPHLKFLKIKLEWVRDE